MLMFTLNLMHPTNNQYTGLQVNIKPQVCTVGVQCSPTPTQQSVGIQCSLQKTCGRPRARPRALVLPRTSSPLPSDTTQSDSEMSECGYEIPDHDTSAFSLQDDTSS